MSMKLAAIALACVAISGLATVADATAPTSDDAVARGGDSLRLEARFGTKDGPQGKSDYRERSRNGTLEQRFKVSVEDFAAGEELAVSVNGAFVGTIFVDGLGMGELQFRTTVDDPGDGVPIPDGFPRLVPGDTVSVGDFTATYSEK